VGRYGALERSGNRRYNNINIQFGAGWTGVVWLRIVRRGGLDWSYVAQNCEERRAGLELCGSEL
jgi:hypothetical protein